MAERATPAAWRIAAAATLAGAPAVGWVAARRPTAGIALVATVGAGLASAVPVALASRRPPIPPRPGLPDQAGPAHPPTRFTVVIAGRDEAVVLPRLLRDLAAQDHRDGAGRPCFEVIVIDDRSTDGSGAIAVAAARREGLEAITRVVRRHGEGLRDGKGAALTAVPPAEYGGDVVVVLDADARLAPDFLSTLDHYVAAGARAITARRRILDAGSSWLAGAQGDEQTVDGELQRGRWALGGLSEFRGNGIVVARDLLTEVGGWRAEALTEDLDLASRVAAARGTGVAWAIDAEVWEEPVRDWRSLWRQRTRWAEGALRRLLEHGPSVVRSPQVAVRAKLDFVAYAGQLLAPPLLIGALAGALADGRRTLAAALVALYGGVAAGLAWDALRWESGTDGGPLAAAERAIRSLRSVAFGCIWLAAVPAALWRLATRRGPVAYDKMRRDGVRS